MEGGAAAAAPPSGTGLLSPLEPQLRRQRGLLRPNLVPWLPSEFGFVAPAGDHPGTAIDRQNLPGEPGVSCHAEEAPDVRCLRFSSGISNVGDGPLFIEFADDEAFQHAYRADDTPDFYGDNEEADAYVERAAGPAEFHGAHFHRHYKDMVLYELFAVSGRRLTDQYRWQRPGQYVPYDLAADPAAGRARGMPAGPSCPRRSSGPTAYATPPSLPSAAEGCRLTRGRPP